MREAPRRTILLGALGMQKEPVAHNHEVLYPDDSWCFRKKYIEHDDLYVHLLCDHFHTNV